MFSLDLLYRIIFFSEHVGAWMCQAPGPWSFAEGTRIFSALSEELSQKKLQQEVSKILTTCFAISVCIFLNRKILQPSFEHFQPPYHTSRLFWLFCNRGTHFGSCWFQVFTSSYYLLFLFVCSGFFSWESESNLPVLARSDLPIPFPRDCWDQEVTQAFAAAEHRADNPLQSCVLYSGKC